MNISERLERGLATIIRDAEIGGHTVVRCWHAVNDDYRWQPHSDKKMPCIDIRASGVSMANAYRATDGRMSVAITAASLAQDDTDHAQIAVMGAAIEKTIYDLRREAITGEAGGVWDHLREAVSTPAGDFTLNSLLQIEAGTPTGGDLLTKTYTLTFAVCVF